ncbi:MAG: TolB family protein [Actinomycetota bacterium]
MAVTMIIGLGAIGAPSEAKVAGPNGQIVFARSDPTVGDTVTYVVNSDGSHERRLFPGASELPHWSPDGSMVVIAAQCTDGADDCAATIVNPDTGAFRQLKMPDPGLFTACWVWSPDATRLACEGQSEADPRPQRHLHHAVVGRRRTDQATSTPGGDDIPGDYSPDGKRIVFVRNNADGTSALSTVMLKGSGVRDISRPGSPTSISGRDRGRPSGLRSCSPPGWPRTSAVLSGPSSGSSS